MAFGRYPSVPTSTALSPSWWREDFHHQRCKVCFCYLLLGGLIRFMNSFKEFGEQGRLFEDVEGDRGSLIYFLGSWEPSLTFQGSWRCSLVILLILFTSNLYGIICSFIELVWCCNGFMEQSKNILRIKRGKQIFGDQGNIERKHFREHSYWYIGIKVREGKNDSDQGECIPPGRSSFICWYQNSCCSILFVDMSPRSSCDGSSVVEGVL